MATQTKQPSATPSAPPSASPPAAPPASPTPAVPAPAAPAPSPGYRPLDDDLLEATGGNPAARPMDPPKPATPSKPDGTPPANPPAEPGATPPGTPPEEHPEPSEPPDEDDFLMGPQPKKPADPPKPAEPAGPLNAPELRAEYAKVKKRLADTEKELSELKKGGSGAIDEGERKAFVSEIEGLKRQLDEVSTTLKSVAYEQSPEYKQKYEQPFIDAWNEGVQLVTGLSVQDAEGNARQGTAEDFAAIMRQPSTEQATTMAQEMFGANAFHVLAQRRDILRAHQQRAKVLEDFRKNFSEREKQQLAKAQAEAKAAEEAHIAANAMFQKLNAEAAQKFPQYFAPIDGDEEGNALLAKGYQDADLAFSGSPQLTPEKRVRLHSAIRNRAAAFGRLVHTIKAKDAQIEALKAELAGFKGSTPGDGEAGREEPAGGRRLTADEEIEAAAR